MELVENLKEIYIPDDYEKAEIACRESYYYLLSLSNILNTSISIGENHREEATVLCAKIQELTFSFDELDSNYHDNVKHEYTLQELFRRHIKYINLKEDIDNLQVNILNLLFEINEEISDSIGHDYQEIKDLRLQQKQDYLLTSALSKSYKSDMFDNYRFYLKIPINGRIVIRRIRGKLKIRNFDFEVGLLRKLYIKSRKNQLLILSKITDLECRNEINKLTKRQFYLNRVITVLTLISVAVAIYALFKT